MAQPYVGEIRMFAGNFAPAGWQLCEGQSLPISENETLFQLIGTTYGGDGQSTFGVPDLRGRLPVHMGNGFSLAEAGGAEEITLTVGQIASHNHPLLATNQGSTLSPLNATFATVSSSEAGVNAYFDQSGAVLLGLVPSSLSATGGGQPHSNFQPYLCVNFIIALFGLFPSQT